MKAHKNMQRVPFSEAEMIINDDGSVRLKHGDLFAEVYSTSCTPRTIEEFKLAFPTGTCADFIFFMKNYVQAYENSPNEKEPEIAKRNLRGPRIHRA